jgi:glucokinase
MGPRYTREIIMKWILLLDVGGTGIKGSVCNLTENSDIRRLKEYPAYADRNKEKIIRNFIYIFTDLIRQIVDDEKSIEAVGLAFPGDFDFENGIPLITNLKKYDSIYGVNLKNEFREKIAVSDFKDRFMPDYRIFFIHDIAAFLIGEIDYLDRKYKKIMACCIGTGTGSAFYAGGNIVDHAYAGVPFKGWIYNTPFKESIIDDYISTRGLMRISGEIVGKSMNGKELDNLARKGDGRAEQVFKQFGVLLAQCLEQFIASFGPDCLVLGGQNAKSADLFSGPLQEVCTRHGTDIIVEKASSDLSLAGLLKYYRNFRT